MDAMILAAGIGSRLRPLTRDTPKVLLEVAGSTVLERIAQRLVDAGADRIIVNTHHLPEQIARFVHDRWELDVEVMLSHEPERPFGTGGGLLHAEPLFRRDGPFILHVGDVISDIDLSSLHRAHGEVDAMVTLAVNRRETSRYLLFDERGLYGRENLSERTSVFAREPVGESLRIAFAGIHVVSPTIFDRITERGVFDILDVYMRLVDEGERIVPFDVSEARWLEIGNPKRLERARRALAADPPGQSL